MLHWGYALLYDDSRIRCLLLHVTIMPVVWVMYVSLAAELEKLCTARMEYRTLMREQSFTTVHE